MIETLAIKNTNDTPEVLLSADTNEFRIEGYSMPEDSLMFYNPIIAWFHEYLAGPVSDMEVRFRMIYFNTASAKQIARVLTVLDGSPARGHITIVWQYETDDTEMLRSGKRFQQQLGLNFVFQEVEPSLDPDLYQEEPVYRVVKNL
ncbi:MAG: DUF1987 domain-containing protein [Bacteroidales bacterium]|nr:DUF1987 domain-containing protein [Bacteroidales bacterium]